MENLESILGEDFRPILEMCMDRHDFKRFLHYYEQIQASPGQTYQKKYIHWRERLKDVDEREWMVVSKAATKAFKKYLDQTGYDTPDYEMPDLDELY